MFTHTCTNTNLLRQFAFMPHTQENRFVCIHIYIHVNINMYTQTCTHIPVHTYMYTYKSVAAVGSHDAYTNIYTYIYTYIYMYTHIYTHIHVQKSCAAVGSHDATIREVCCMRRYLPASGVYIWSPPFCFPHAHAHTPSVSN